MYIKMNKIISVILLVITTSMFSIERYVNPDMIKKSGPPMFTDKQIIITLPETGIYSAFLRTDIDHWKTDHHFNKSYYGIYYCTIDYPKNMNRILYRLNVNGFWDADRSVNDYYTDNYGNDFSILDVPDSIKYVKNTPEINEVTDSAKKVTFRIYAPNANEVNLLCSNTGYSRFANRMTINSDGYWEIDMIFGPGRYGYYFMVDGKKYIDIGNKEKVYDTVLGQLSSIVIR